MYSVVEVEEITVLPNPVTWSAGQFSSEMAVPPQLDVQF